VGQTFEQNVGNFLRNSALWSPNRERRVNIGSSKIITDLADELKITREVAETVASVMPNKVESKLRNLLNPIAQELRGAIEYFEFDRDEPVNHAYISGGLTGSDIIAGLLQDSMGVPCTKWDFTKNIEVNLAPEKEESLQKDVFQLSDAFGAGLAWFKDDLIRLNLYADHLEAVEAHRRDPVRIGIRVSAILVGLMFVWIIALQVRIYSLVAVQESYQARIQGLHEKSSQVKSDSRQIIEFEQVLLRMRTFSDNRHLHARFLNALQFIKVDGFEFVSLEFRIMQEILPRLDPPLDKNGVEKIVEVRIPKEEIELTIRARDSDSATDNFIEKVSNDSFFKERLVSPIKLVEHLSPQIDLDDLSKTFILVTLRMTFK
jgi:hypothetical protein